MPCLMEFLNELLSLMECLIGPGQTRAALAATLQPAVAAQLAAAA